MYQQAIKTPFGMAIAFGKSCVSCTRTPPPERDNPIADNRPPKFVFDFTVWFYTGLLIRSRILDQHHSLSGMQIAILAPRFSVPIQPSSPMPHYDCLAGLALVEDADC